MFDFILLSIYWKRLGTCKRAPGNLFRDRQSSLVCGRATRAVRTASWSSDVGCGSHAGTTHLKTPHATLSQRSLATLISLRAGTMHAIVGHFFQARTTESKLRCLFLFARNAFVTRRARHWCRRSSIYFFLSTR